MYGPLHSCETRQNWGSAFPKNIFPSMVAGRLLISEARWERREVPSVLQQWQFLGCNQLELMTYLIAFGEGW